MMFQKGIKRDQSHFPTLKSEPLNDSWHRTFEIQAHAQGVAHILDSKYSPSTPEEKELFQLVQTFMYAVLESKVQTHKGQEIIRKYEDTKDAQSAYADLLAHHRKSIAANIEAVSIMSYLTTTTIGDGKFKGSTSQFLTHWSNQLRKYHTIKGKSSTIDDDDKIMYLSRAVATVPELRNIKVTADLMQVTNKDPIDFERYYELLFAAAVQYDDSLSHKPKRLIYSHEIGEEWGGDAHQEYEETYDIDTPVSYIEANAHMHKPRRQKGRAMGSSPHRGNHRVMIPKEVWHALSDEFKMAWSNLSEEEKTMILSTGQVPTTTRMAQLHERSQDEDVEEEFQDALDDAPAETGQDSDQIQVHNTQQQSSPKFPPYDIRSILSSKGKATSTRSGHMCVISKLVVYRVSSTAVISKQSLVDRGANGGIAGQDCKVICVSDRTVDVQGIDSHQLNSVSIGTAAGYVNSNKGPVILILHQYALVGRGHTIHSPGQLEWFKHSVCDKSVHVGGLQRIKTADGYTIPIAMVHGLPRIRMRPPTDKEFDTLPHIVLTSDNTWDPSVLDFDHEEEDEQWFDAIEHQEAHPYSELFDEYGNYRRRVIVQLSDTLSRPSSDPHEHLIDQYQQHQNYAERKIQHLKRMANTIMDRTGAPASTWLLCLMYVAFLLNHTWSDNIKAVPLTALLGVTVDTSVLLRYHFWQPVYFKAVEPGFPSDTKEHLGHVVGISEHVGHALTWKVLDSTTNKVLHRSLLRPANETAPNLRLVMLGGEDPSTVRPTIFSKSFDTSDDGTIRDDPMDEGTKGRVLNEKGDALEQLSDLVGMTFLTDPQPDGQVFRARVVEMIDNHDDEVESHPDRIKFLCKMDKNGREDLLTYNQVLDYLNRDMENPVLWKYKKIVSHQGPLRQGDKDYKGSAWNVLLEWETGEVTAEPLNIIAKDDPVTCAIYAKENGLLNTEGWKRFKSCARREKKFTRMVKQAFLRSFRTSPKYKYGHEIPQSYEDALRLDRIAGNTKWQDAVGLELGQIHEYKSYIFGDNESVINSSAQLHAKLHKRHNMLSFHYVREAVATGFLHLTHIPGKINPADMLSKHWGYSDIKDILKALLFHRGDTAEMGQNRDSMHVRRCDL
ncbi:hypothetical protein IV203_010195 [Nitzschia inconspicua]|uniref:Uncharacterized protein n=1 Tax=Nitzschia inconspicua TaxID=303405 RepID=A0A9K3KX80_9STRA|nr:hypothetical protein IV203_010195 [Nitzschia inconspicua]